MAGRDAEGGAFDMISVCIVLFIPRGRVMSGTRGVVLAAFLNSPTFVRLFTTIYLAQKRLAQSSLNQPTASQNEPVTQMNHRMDK